MRDRPPQTAGEALRYGWHGITVRCVMCRHKGTVQIAGLPEREGLARIIYLVRCSACGGRDVDSSLVTLTGHEKPIITVGATIEKLGMN